MGDVHAARDRQIGRDVAVKRLRGTAQDLPPIALERFMREACIQGRLDHPAIVPVHELGVDADGMPYFVMKKLSGITLSRIIAKPDPRQHSRQRLLRAFVDLCLAVEFAHARGFIHRDLKPDNVVLGEYGEVYVLDWGVAKVVGADDPALADSGERMATREGAVVGTAGYMSPEHARGDRDLDVRADVYALGCVLFEILSGQRLHPLGDEGMQSAIAGKIDARPSRRAPDRDIPPELDEICLRATATSRDERISSARGLGELVEKFLDGDRDLALRRELAREQLDKATQAFRASDVTDARRDAMRFAGRALALDPTLHQAAELVGRLMLEPPRDLPREVVASVAADRAESIRWVARVGLAAHVAYLVCIGFVFGIGFADPLYPVGVFALIAANMFFLAWTIRRPQLSWLPMVLLLGNALLIALLAHMFSPFFIAPAIAAVTGMAFALGLLPTERHAASITIAVMVLAVLVPWGLEVAGVLPVSFVITPTTMVMYSPGLGQDDAISVYVLAIYAIALVSAAVLMATAVRRADADVRKSLHLQAWQLRQLVPLRS
jgi:serine/threonine-protein kinase